LSGGFGTVARVSSTEDLPQLDATVATSRLDDGTHVLAVRGELDLYSTPQLTAELETIAGEPTNVVVDLTEVSFMDSTALGAILLASRRLRDANRRLALVSPVAATTKLLTMVGIDRVVPVVESREQALERLRG
jgi:anti-sigma B factor antagonist